MDISPAIIDSMITKSTFDMGLVNISMTSHLGEVSIILCLLQEGTNYIERNPISGFPRALAAPDLIQRSGNPTPKTK